MKVVIAGANGFVGSQLSSFFKEQGDELVLLSRHPKDKETFWNPDEGKIDLSALEGSNVLINLSGENIFGRWTKAKLERIKKSRLTPTEFLVESVLRLQKRPELFINASAVGIYGNRSEEILTEGSRAGTGILADICESWEKIPKRLEKENIRVALCRFGIILGKEGGILQKIKNPFKYGLGGKIGTGEQYMSWIAIEDVCRGMQHVIVHHDLSGAINFCSPNPIKNKYFTKEMSRVTKTPALMHVPGSLISLIFGSGKEMFLSSVRAVPKKLLDNGYVFSYTDLSLALKKHLNM